MSTATAVCRQRELVQIRMLSCARASTSTSSRHRLRLNVSACRKCRAQSSSPLVLKARRVSICVDATTDSDESAKESKVSKSSDGASAPDADTMSMKIAMGLLDFYRREISPLLPKSCRFVPTCSEYARQAYKKYGTSKGFVLTAWRLMRCNPLGDKGYDPPMWPPPHLGSKPASLD